MLQHAMYASELMYHATHHSQKHHDVKQRHCDKFGRNDFCWITVGKKDTVLQGTNDFWCKTHFIIWLRKLKKIKIVFYNLLSNIPQWSLHSTPAKQTIELPLMSAARASLNEIESGAATQWDKTESSAGRNTHLAAIEPRNNAFFGIQLHTG